MFGNKSGFRCQVIGCRNICFVFIIATVILYFLVQSVLAGNIKEPNVAGGFYPDKAQDLSDMVDIFLKVADPAPMPGEIFALICPHAGYGFSGQVAAYGYKLIKDKPYKTVIVIGPSHYYGFNGVSIYPEGVFRTPLGDVAIDTEFTQKLLNKDKDILFEPRAFEKEHSVEVQLPFVQRALSNFSIVPIVIGDCPLVTCEKLANLIQQAIGSRKDILVIASSDMYHGYDYEELARIDDVTLGALKKMDAEALYYGVRENRFQLCGGLPVVTTIILAKKLGHNKLNVLRHTNSAVVTGKKVKGVWTVGYASCAIDQINPVREIKASSVSLVSNGVKKEGAMLNEIQKKKLLEIARKSIETYLKTNRRLELTQTDPILCKNLGAFVTLREHNELRGCIGNLTAVEPLYLCIRDMAVEAAVGDPRFNPLQLSELKDINIEISVLSPLERVASAEMIKLGVHGVIVRKGFNSGVFLPQVATETGWSKEEFLSNLCAHKAGLAADAWKDKSCELYVFTAEVFSE